MNLNTDQTNQPSTTNLLHLICEHEQLSGPGGWWLVGYMSFYKNKSRYFYFSLKTASKSANAACRHHHCPVRVPCPALPYHPLKCLSSTMSYDRIILILNIYNEDTRLVTINNLLKSNLEVDSASTSYA